MKVIGLVLAFVLISLGEASAHGVVWYGDADTGTYYSGDSKTGVPVRRDAKNCWRRVDNNELAYAYRQGKDGTCADQVPTKSRKAVKKK